MEKLPVELISRIIDCTAILCHQQDETDLFPPQILPRETLPSFNRCRNNFLSSHAITLYGEKGAIAHRLRTIMAAFQTALSRK